MILKEKKPKLKVMIVENDPVLARDLKQSLERMGYFVSGVEKTRKEVMEGLESVRVDLVLIDIQLKKKTSGIQASRDIQSRFDVPVVFLSDIPEEKVLQQIQATTPHGFLLKPYKDAELESEIAIALSQHHQQNIFKKAEKRLRFALMCTGYGVLITDGVGNIVLMNDAVKEQAGFVSEHDLTGKSLNHVIRITGTDSDWNTEALMQEVIQEGKRIFLKSFQMFNSKTKTWIHMTGEGAPIQAERYQILGMIFIFHVK
ncbi:response regulator [bacterium]|nr:response regulator [bacterium]